MGTPSPALRGRGLGEGGRAAPRLAADARNGETCGTPLGAAACPHPPRPIALIIGASRGLGLGLAEEYLKRGWRVVATARGTAKTKLHDLADRADGRLEIEKLDIVDEPQIAALRGRLKTWSFELLFVNAGIHKRSLSNHRRGLDRGFHSRDGHQRARADALVEAFTSRHATGTIGVMSSGLGSVAGNVTGGWEVYRASKAALNTLMRSYAARHAGDPRALVIIAPGWIRTDMGGPDATFSIEENIPGVVDVIASRAGKPGLRYLDYRGKDVAW